MKLTVDPKDPKSIVQVFKDVFGDAQAFFGEIGKTAEAVPEPFRQQFASLKDKINGVIKEMPMMTDQVMASMDAGRAMEQMCWAMERMQEVYQSAVSGLQKMLADLGPQAQQAQQLNGRIERGELLGDDKLTQRIAAEVELARQEERGRAALLGKRRQLLASAKLPVPVEDAVLEGDDQAFGAAQTQATDRIKKLGELGVDLQQLNAAQVSNLAYGSQESFDILVGLHKATRGQRGKTTDGDPEPEPMAGGGKAGADDGGKRLTF